MDIGSNKPTAEEMADTPHHMVDICDPKETLSAADFVNMITPIIYDVLERGKLPIIVGGSTMWLQWLVHGIPDAPKPSPFAIEESERLLCGLQGEGRWEEALALVMAFDATRTAKLARNDWYRLKRYLEVALTINTGSIEGSPMLCLTGKRCVAMEDLDVRSYFIAETRDALYRVIDKVTFCYHRYAYTTPAPSPYHPVA